MNASKSVLITLALSVAAFLAGCQSTNENANTTATTTASPPVKQELTVVSRPWHESYKNEGAFQIATFNVKGGGDTSKPTTTNKGETMASPMKSPAANASPSPTREGKDMAKSNAGDLDLTKPLLTYSRPKG